MVSCNLPKTKTNLKIVKKIKQTDALPRADSVFTLLISLELILKFYFFYNRCLISVLLHS